MKFVIFLGIFFISACSVQVIDMTAEPTVQKFDLSDSEGDGIISARDECPESNTGAQVSNNGCGSNTVETVHRKLEVNFDNNSYAVKSEYLFEVEKLADFMIEYPQTEVAIEGHTSIRGKAALNKKLSQNRAQAIKNILIKKFNITDERITAVGYGFENLLLEGDDEYIHARNRRIVAEISSDRSLTDMKWTIYSVDDELE
ncbi:OmpA family protein [Psychromonas sp. Urea-02u-13]|uniref:OmpA family protein n=1 Tax=Psychromonas sp. Urea-02u-13 TaxID=2058326 RepID=UPI000C333419|nr:OmpA family protein [Psychromonas sp. Urea-02u-13]PKG39279.1 OmpA family protein [Psychromonas sp. Urea-02u-13]